MNDWLTPCYLWKIPQKPRLETVPLPPVTPSDDTWGLGGDYDGGEDDRGEDDLPARNTEKSTSLAAAKPNNIENGARSGVRLFFTPPEIVLYTNGFDNSQAAQLPQIQGAATTERRTPRRSPGASSGSVRYWRFPKRKGTSPPFRPVCQFFRTGRSEIGF